MQGFDAETGELLPYEIKAAQIIAGRIRHNIREPNAANERRRRRGHW